MLDCSQYTRTRTKFPIQVTYNVGNRVRLTRFLLQFYSYTNLLRPRARTHTETDTGKTCTASTAACPTQEKKTSVISSAAARFPHSPENQSICSTRTCSVEANVPICCCLHFSKSCTVQNALIAPPLHQKNRGCNQCSNIHLNCSVRFEWRISPRGISGDKSARALRADCRHSHGNGSRRPDDCTPHSKHSVSK